MKKEDAIKYLQQLYPNGGHCWLDEQRIEAISMAIKALQEEPVSEPNKELAETYLAVFGKKFPILPSLKGKQLADYKNFLNKCQQIFGLKEWGIRPIQSKLFEKLSLLWAAWGAEHLQGVCRQDEKEQDIPVSDGLEEACEQLAENARKHKAETSSPFFSQTDYRQGVIDGAQWQKKQMMAKAFDGEILENYDGKVIKYDDTILDEKLSDCKVFDKVKIIVIKED